jgi:hypothetical protein
MLNTMFRYLAGSSLILLALSATARADDFRQTVRVEPGGTLEVDLSSGAIEVETHEGNEVSVEGRSGGRTRFELTSDGRNARLIGRRQGFWSIFSPGRVRVEILVPEEYSLDLDTGGGSIEIEGIHGRIVAHTSGGRIEVDEVEGPVELETSGGSIRIDDANGPVEARTSGGSIEVRFSGSPGGLLKTSGGSIDAELPRDSGIYLDAKTSGGRVHVETEITVKGTQERSHITGKINGGGPHLELRTSGGNIRVSQR